ncbi:MAG: cell wall-active antibiotics response protein [Ignavibacteriae bacterium]|nr:cell wall-active antibiotics response protein [Ignavibacteriota bacterium]
MRYSFGGVILILIGGLFLLDNLGVADFGEVISTFWPLILIVWGFTVLRNRRKPKPETCDLPRTDIHQTLGGELIHESNVFGDIFLSITSQVFKGGSINGTFGDIELDLSKTTFAEGEHFLRIHGVFGDCTIITPKDSAVTVSASSTAGDLYVFGQKKSGFSPSIDAVSPSYANSTSRLKIMVSITFGDIKVS